VDVNGTIVSYGPLTTLGAGLFALLFWSCEMKNALLFGGGLVLALVVGRSMIPSRSSVNTQTRLAKHDAPIEGTTLRADGEVQVPVNASHESGDSAEQERRDMDQRGTKVFINGRELSREQLIAISATYHYFPPPGRYWYDNLSGAWGMQGHETAGFLLPGHGFGPLPEDASNGNTGVFVNGRELNMAEAMSIQQNFGAVYRGRWWLDGRTGNFGAEGNPVPLGNLIALVRARQNTRGGDNFWCSATACGNDDGRSGYVDVGGTIVGYDH
jgi:hypothetical protein